MTIVLARRLRRFHSLLEMALKDGRVQPRRCDRTAAGIRKKPTIRGRLAVLDGLQTPPALRWPPKGSAAPPTADPDRLPDTNMRRRWPAT